MNPIIQPLNRSIPLASTPQLEPRFAVSARLRSGEEIPFADPRATRALVALMNMHAVLGGAAGHWGGPSALAELMSALHGLMFFEARKAKREWYELFHFVNDGGHCENGLYALKANYQYDDLTFEDLKSFRSLGSRLTGHGESHLFPEGVFLSNGPLGSAMPQSQGLAYGDYLAGRDRVTVTVITDAGCMEGEAREAMAAIPGLAAKGKMAPYLLLISDNNTKLTGRIDDDAFSMTPSFAALSALGWEVIDFRDSHDLQKCVTVLEQALQKVRENPRKPIAIHARTIKGYGVKKTMESKSGGHGFPLKAPSELMPFLTEIYGGAEVPKLFADWVKELEEVQASKKSSGSKAPTQKVQIGISKVLIKKKEEGLPVFSVSSDLPGSTGVGEFHKACPQNFQDVGVAESNMISMAAGLAKLGYIPVVDTFAQFGVTKGALPLTMAALSQAPVIAIFSHAGFQDAGDGASHQALAYFAMSGAIPHTQVYALTCSDEAEALLGQAIDDYAAKIKSNQVPESYLFFLGRENFPANFGVTKFELGKAQVLRSSDNPAVVVAAAGPLVEQALEAAETLAKEGMEVVVINPAIINHPDVNTFANYLQKCGRLLTVEDHQLIGGMGSQLIHALTLAGLSFKAESLAVRGEFGQSAYTAIELYRKHELDAQAIVQAVRRLQKKS